MSPLVVAAAGCALLVVLTVVLAVRLGRAQRSLARTVRAHGDEVRALRDELAALRTRHSELERAASPIDPPADPGYVITFDPDDPRPVPAQRVVSTTLGEPLIKLAAFGHGVRRALAEERRAHLAYQVRREYRRRRRSTRSATRRAR